MVTLNNHSQHIYKYNSTYKNIKCYCYRMDVDCAQYQYMKSCMACKFVGTMWFWLTAILDFLPNFAIFDLLWLYLRPPSCICAYVSSGPQFGSVHLKRPKDAVALMFTLHHPMSWLCNTTNSKWQTHRVLHTPVGAAIKWAIAPRYLENQASQCEFLNLKTSSSKQIDNNFKQWWKRFPDDRC